MSGSDTTNSVVEIKNLTKRFGEFTAVQDLSLHVNRGQILGFIGPNGAGKTTTIKILVGLSKPTSGTAKIDGVDCSSGSKKIKHLVGYMPDRFGSYDNMRVHEYLDFFAAAYGISIRRRKARVDEVLEITSSGYMRDRFVESLSHGMQQRIGIARVLLHDPQVLILDEPANGLDPQARIEMRELLLSLAQSGKTLIVTSHILPELSRICDCVAIITGGRLKAFGSLDTVMRRLCPKRQFEIQMLDQRGVDKAESIVRNSLGQDAEIHISPAEAIVRFSTQQNEGDLSNLLQQIVESGANVTQFRELSSDLEDAFLSAASDTAQANGTTVAADIQTAKETKIA
jgi:ABC-2 type transport system ATP-binding protein